MASKCGNGFVELGEECDCGPKQFCKNPCCDASTCLLRPNASCATGDCCDLTGCSLRMAGSLCRTADDECDLPEFCTGKSEVCPENIFRQNSIKCDGGKAFCYQGRCRSHDAQCRVLWGPSGRSSTGCYRKNTKGFRGGNCGFNKRTLEFEKCETENVMCGLMHCHSNERLEFGSLRGYKSMISRQFISVNSVVQHCDTVNGISQMQAADPGLAPNGAKCGENRMCLKQQCVSIL